MKKNIALVMGGFSGEHDISIASGRQVYEQLDHSRYNVYKIVVDRAGWYWECGDEHRPIDRGDFTVIDAGVTVHFDLAFIIVHGNPGENGVLQGYFDMLGIRYTTCGYYTSALTFHKGYCNPVVKNFGIVKVANSVLLYKEQWDVERWNSANRLSAILSSSPRFREAGCRRQQRCHHQGEEPRGPARRHP